MLSSAISYASRKEKKKKKKKWRTEGGRRRRKGASVRVGMGESIGGESVDSSGTSGNCMGTKRQGLLGGVSTDLDVQSHELQRVGV